MGKKSDGGMAAAMAEAARLQRLATREFEGLEEYIPEEERLLYTGLVAPELVLPSAEERIRETELAGVELDPRLQEAQEEALAELEQRGREGLTAEDRAKMEALRRQVGADEQARQATILAQMAQRGALDSGAQLAAQLASSQAATQRAAVGADELAAQAAAARRQALAQAAQTASGMQQAKYGRESDVARARDQIAAFNAAVAQRGTQARQQQARDIANVKMMQEQQRVQAAQMPFQQRMQLAGAKAGALSGQANVAMQRASMSQPQRSGFASALAGAGTGALIGSKMGGGLGAGIGAGVGALGGLLSKDGGIKKYEDGGIEKEYQQGGIDPITGLPRELGERRQFGLDTGAIQRAGRDILEDIGPRDPERDFGRAGIPAEAERERYNREQARRGIELAKERRAMEEGVVGSGQVSRRELDEARNQVRDEAPAKDKDTGLTGKNIASALGALGGIVGGGDEASRRRSISPTRLNLPDVRQIESAQIRPFADGGMNYQAGGEGTIIDSGEESYVGDELEDRINDREMVLNLDQQDHLEDLLKELAEYRRADQMVADGRADVNEPQQETLMDIARGEAEPEDLNPEREIVEPEMSEEEMMPEMMNMYQAGGIAPNPLDALLGDLDRLRAGGRRPEDITIPLKPEMPADMREDVRPTKEARAEVERIPERKPAIKPEPKEKPESKKKDESKTVSLTSDELFKREMAKIDDERTGAMIADAISAFANIVNRNQPPGTQIQIPMNALDNLEKKRDKIKKAKTEADKQAALVEYRKATLDMQKDAQALQMKRLESTEAERKERREERKQAEARRLSKDQINAARNFLKDDPRFKKAVEQGTEFESVDRLLTEAAAGNQAAVAALGTKLARAMGEVGVLTDTDVVRYVGGTSWGRKLKDWYEKGATGKPSEATLRDIAKNLKVLKSKLGKDIDRVYGNAHSRMKTAYPDLEDKTIRGLLGQPILGTQEQKELQKKEGTNVRVKRKRDNKVITMTRENAQKYLAQPDKFEEVK